MLSHLNSRICWAYGTIVEQEIERCVNIDTLHSLGIRLRIPLTSRSDVLGLVGQIALLLVGSRVTLNLFNLFAHAVQLRVDPRRSLVQLHQKI